MIKFAREAPKFVKELGSGGFRDSAKVGHQTIEQSTPGGGVSRRKRHLYWLMLVGVFLWGNRGRAFELGYAGRLLKEDGAPLTGQVNVTVRFYSSAFGAEQLGASIDVGAVALSDGLFQLALNLDAVQQTAIFGDGSRSVFIEVEAEGKVYPRQSFFAVPMALRVPIDHDTLAFDPSTSKLAVQHVGIEQVTGLSQALAGKLDGNRKASSNSSGYLSQEDWARFDAKQSPISSQTVLDAGTLTTSEQIGVMLRPYGTSPEQTGELRFLAASSLHYVGFKAPDPININQMWTLPPTDGNSGDVLRTDGNGALSWMNLGTGGLATLDAVSGGPQGTIVDGTITNLDISASAAIADSKLQTLTTAGKVSGQALTSGTIGGTTSFAGSGGIQTTGAIEGSGNIQLKAANQSATELRFADGANQFFVGFKAPETLTANRVWTLPLVDGQAGDVLKTNGSGALFWSNPGSHGVMLGSNNLSELTDVLLARSNLGLGSLSTSSEIASSDIRDGSITNTDIASNAAIATAKLTGLLTAVSGHGLGTLAGLNQVTGPEIVDGTISNADISSTAALSTVKLSGPVTAIPDHGLGALALLSTVGGGEISNGSIANDDVAANAGIATSKLSGSLLGIAGHGLGVLATRDNVGSNEIINGSIVDADVAPTAAITDGKLATITSVGKVSGGSITSGIIGGSSSFAGSGGVITTGSISGSGNFNVNGTGAATSALRFGDKTNTYSIALRAPATLAGDVALQLPGDDGSSGQLLATDGDGNLLWTSGAAPTGLAGGDLTGNFPTPYLKPTGVLPGTYAKVSVDDKGRVTSGNSTIVSAEIADGTILNADIANTAGIATNKLSGALTEVAGHGLGALSGLNQISNAEVASNAAIATTKLSGALTSVAGHGLGALAGVSQIGNAEVAIGAAIATAKLSGDVMSISGHGLGTLSTQNQISDSNVATNAAIATTKISGALTLIAGHGLGSMATLTQIADANVASNAAVSTSKLSGPVMAIGSHGLGSLATINQISNADVASGAAVATSKLSGSLLAISGHGLGGLATMSGVDSQTIINNSIIDVDIATNAAIASTKIRFDDDTISGNAIHGGVISNFSSLGIQDSATSNLMTLTVGSNVGIGTTSPGQKLSVAGVVESTTGGFKFPDGTTQTTAASGSGQWSTSGSNVYRSSGNVGIGTTSPIFTLNTTDQGTIGAGILRLQNSYMGNPNNTGSFGIQLAGVDNGSNGHDLRIQGRTTASGSFVDLMTVKNNGSVGIGTSSPSFNLHLSGNTAGEVSAAIQNLNSGTSSYAALRINSDNVNPLAIFINSTTRTADGGVNTGTIRNDAGALRLQSAGGSGIFVASSTGYTGILTAAPSYPLDVNGDTLAGWYRSRNNSGWYSETYGGGWYMTDTTWIRAVNNKNIYTAGSIQGDGTIQAGSLVSTGNSQINGELKLQGSILRFRTDPGGGSGDNAWLYYYAEAGENTRLEMRVQNDGDDDIFIRATGGTTTGTGDLAELYFSHDSLQIGDLVAFDPTTPGAVRKSRGDHRSTLLGVTSAKPFALLMALSREKLDRSDYHPISLAGKMMVKISLENGPIRAGDPLTAATEPGHATKATSSGKIIGYAFEDYDGSYLSTPGVEEMFRDISDCRNCEENLRVLPYLPQTEVGTHARGIMLALVQPGFYLAPDNTGASIEALRQENLAKGTEIDRLKQELDAIKTVLCTIRHEAELCTR